MTIIKIVPVSRFYLFFNFQNDKNKIPQLVSFNTIIFISIILNYVIDMTSSITFGQFSIGNLFHDQSKLLYSMDDQYISRMKVCLCLPFSEQCSPLLILSSLFSGLSFHNLHMEEVNITQRNGLDLPTCYIYYSLLKGCDLRCPISSGWYFS